MNLFERLYRLAQSMTSEQMDSLEKILQKHENGLDEILTSWENQQRLKKDNQKTHGYNNNSYREKSNQKTHSNEKQQSSPKPDFGQDDQFLEDLGLFGLKPPVSRQQVKQVRNREIKKYHPDRFLQSPEKLETAKRILQIYNLAYERIINHPSIQDN